MLERASFKQFVNDDASLIKSLAVDRPLISSSFNFFASDRGLSFTVCLNDAQPVDNSVFCSGGSVVCSVTEQRKCLIMQGKIRLFQCSGVFR